jgi:hypothetical protein
MGVAVQLSLTSAFGTPSGTRRIAFSKKEVHGWADASNTGRRPRQSGDPYRTVRWPKERTL